VICGLVILFGMWRREWDSKPTVSEQAHKQRRTTANIPSLKILTDITEGAIGSIWEQVWTTKSAYFSKNSKMTNEWARSPIPGEENAIGIDYRREEFATTAGRTSGLCGDSAA